MANIDLTSADEVDRVEYRSGETFGKPNSAILQVSYSPTGNESFEDVVAEAVTIAEVGGWDMRERTPSRSFIGTMQQDSHELTLEVFVATEAETVVLQLTTE